MMKFHIICSDQLPATRHRRAIAYQQDTTKGVPRAERSQIIMQIRGEPIQNPQFRPSSIDIWGVATSVQAHCCHSYTNWKQSSDNFCQQSIVVASVRAKYVGRISGLRVIRYRWTEPGLCCESIVHFSGTRGDEQRVGRLPRGRDGVECAPCLPEIRFE